jgi:hypothetical protein
MKANGATLVSVTHTLFVFQSATPLGEWRLKFNESKHKPYAKELLDLKRLQKKVPISSAV